MRAISLKQPYCSWIAHGEKTIETRRWKTKYRGPLLICSSKNDDLLRWFMLEGVATMGQQGFPLGVAMCVADLVNCRPMVKADEKAAKCELYPGAYAWELKNVRLIEAFPVKGMLSLFEVDVRGVASSGFSMKHMKEMFVEDLIKEWDGPASLRNETIGGS